MKRLALFISLTLLGGWLCNNYAQFTEPSITFNKTSHNFGNVAEAGGIQSCEFHCSNNGSQPLIIHDVNTTCGCTVPEWSREPIPAGGKGVIRVDFDPLGRPGAFRKSITVKSNARESSVNLYIIGLVSPKPKTVADDFPIRMGKIRLATNHLSLMTVYKNQVKTDTIGFYNDSDSAVSVTLNDLPPHLSAKVEPARLEPGKRGAIGITFDATKNSDWGFVMDRLYLSVNNTLATETMLAVSAQLEEDFGSWTPEKKQGAPKAVLSEDSFNFGTITAGQKIIHEFKLSNTGKDPLIIRKISTTCGCTASKPGTYEIPGGQETTITCSFDSRGKVGKQFQTVTLILNDPSASSMVIRLIGTVASSGK